MACRRRFWVVITVCSRILASGQDASSLCLSLRTAYNIRRKRPSRSGAYQNQVAHACDFNGSSHFIYPRSGPRP